MRSRRAKIASASSFEAQAYANDVVPKASGEAARRQADAEAYKARVTADAQGEAARFEALLKEYELAPAVTRERLYIEAVEEVLTPLQQGRCSTRAAAAT